MDYALAEVVTAVHHGSSTNAQRWFTLVCDEYRDLDSSGAGDDWDQFVQRLTSRAGNESFSGDDVDAFTDRANSHGGADLVRRLAELGPDQLTAEYQQLLDEESAAPEEGQSEEYDEDAWSSYLAENATMWNGTEDTWTQFRDWFLHYANERGLGVPAGAFLDYADSQGDKAAVFAQYGITLPTSAPAAITADADAVAAAVADRIRSRLLAEVPGAADLTPGQLQQLIDSVLSGGPVDAAPPADSPLGDPAEVARSVAATVTERLRAQLLAELPEAADLAPEQLRQLVDSVLAGQAGNPAAGAALDNPAEVAQSVIAAASERLRAQLLSEVPGADRLLPEQLQQIIDGALTG